MDVRQQTHRRGHAGDQPHRRESPEHIRPLDANEHQAEREDGHRQDGGSQANRKGPYSWDRRVHSTESQDDQESQIKGRHRGDRRGRGQSGAALDEQAPARGGGRSEDQRKQDHRGDQNE